MPPIAVFLTFIFCLTAPGPARAWGQDGHSIVAELAQRRLSPGARRAVEAILGAGVSLASVSSWADDWRADHHETTRWHFVDIDVMAPSYDASRDCQEREGLGDCIVAELQRAAATLSDPALTPPDKRTALMFVVHLVGALTQPLHCSMRSDDGGGNGLYVDFDGRKEHRKAIRFHALWDETLIADQVYNWGAFVTDLEAGVMPGLDPLAIRAGSYADWATDCHQAGIAAYAALPLGPDKNTPQHPVALGSAYAEATLPLLKGQLAKGGIRLAHVLNEALAPR